MTTVTFKVKDPFKEKLELISEKKGINVSAYIKLILTKEIDEELSKVTANGMTVAEELAILKSASSDKVSKQYNNAEDLLSSLGLK